jgi:hypothetical protein
MIWTAELMDLCRETDPFREIVGYVVNHEGKKVKCENGMIRIDLRTVSVELAGLWIGLKGNICEGVRS